MKSSLQRQIRNKILEQYPYLSLPALPLPKSLVPEQGGVDSDEEERLEEEDLGNKRKKGAGKEKKSKKESGKGGKKGGRKQADEVEEPEQKEEGPTGGEEEVLTVMDTLWPKKEGCSLVKWCENLLTLHSPHHRTHSTLGTTAEIIYRCSQCMANLCSFNISMVLSTQL